MMKNTLLILTVMLSIAALADNTYYYSLETFQVSLGVLEQKAKKNNYELISYGKSVEGRDLVVLQPTFFTEGKKTFLLTCRHHGDESTSNWILEGFLDRLLDTREGQTFLENYQIIVFPFLNPDGAQNRTRRNANGLDLNRYWSEYPHFEKDESATTHTYLRSLMEEHQPNILFALDLHGSTKGDYIYVSPIEDVGSHLHSFYHGFIRELGKLDPYQNGRSVDSSGHIGMFRTVMMRAHKIPALTHETMKNILKRNPGGRNIDTLKEQGSSLLPALIWAASNQPESSPL